MAYRTILNGSEDWELWYVELVASISGEFWPVADPDQPDVLPIPLPNRPEVEDLAPGVTDYLLLTTAQQRTFDYTRKYYYEDHEQFVRQEDALTDLRRHILDTVPATNRVDLRANMPVKEWIRILRDRVEAPKGYLIAMAKEKYDALFRARTKPLEWLNKWEKIITNAQRYDMTEFKNGIWLAQMASWIRPHSAKLSLMLYNRSNNPDEQHISAYPAVLRDIRQYLKNEMKQTIRGEAFQPTVDGEEKLLKKRATTSFKRKRANTTGEPASNKKQTLTCPACERKGHYLRNCWFIFPDLAPKHIVISKQTTDRVLRKTKGSDKLRKQVDKIKKNMEKK